MPTSKHKLISAQDSHVNAILAELNGIEEKGRMEAWYLFLHLLKARRDDLQSFLEAMRTRIEQWDYRRREQPFLPTDTRQGTCWVEAVMEIRRFRNESEKLMASLGLAGTIAMCFSAVCIGDRSPLDKLRAIARENETR